jgi:divalent metal cation (Fe/Co/Zn/Cd) transporter
VDKKKQEHIFKAYKRKKKINLIVTIVVFAAAFFAFWYSNNKELFTSETLRTIIPYVISIIAIGGLAVSYFNWRCPVCKQSLGRIMTMNQNVCRKCGTKLQ